MADFKDIYLHFVPFILIHRITTNYYCYNACTSYLRDHKRSTLQTAIRERLFGLDQQSWECSFRGYILWSSPWSVGRCIFTMKIISNISSVMASIRPRVSIILIQFLMLLYAYRMQNFVVWVRGIYFIGAPIAALLYSPTPTTLSEMRRKGKVEKERNSDS